MRRCVWIFGSLLLMFMFLQVTAFSQDDKIVAMIGDRRITVSDFNKMINYFDEESRKNLERNPEKKLTVLHQRVQSIVIYDIAKSRGFDKRPEIKEQLQFFTENFVANEYLKREVAQKVAGSGQEQIKIKVREFIDKAMNDSRAVVYSDALMGEIIERNK